jgi:ribosomal protein L37AE/L43A
MFVDVLYICMITGVRDMDYEYGYRHECPNCKSQKTERLHSTLETKGWRVPPHEIIKCNDCGIKYKNQLKLDNQTVVGRPKKRN